MIRQTLSIEQRVLRDVRQLVHSPSRVLMAISGGVDSMVMAEILSQWQAGLGIEELTVAHVHHGLGNQFRDEALALVRQWAEQRKLRFLTNTAEALSDVNSEEELRLYRNRHLRQWSAECGADAVAYAHHRDDLLETRVLRLIRGSGKQGLTAMTLFRQGKFRPLLNLARTEIEDYALAKGLHWKMDPSNAVDDALRNWLRNQWLPALERKRPGAMKTLARSIETLLPQALGQEWPDIPYVGLRRELFISADVSERRELLARYLRAMGINGYGQTHIDEIVKRLRTRRKNFAFAMLGLKFTVSPDFLWASRV